MAELRFDGRSVVVTGAGRGLGRAHARLLAARGAQVIVNDLGTTMEGEREDTSPAEAVVEEIRSAGGVAEADDNDITSETGAAAIVAAAVEAFGGLDAVVNNAGIYGLDSMAELTVEDIRRYLRTHVEGTFNVTKAAWPHLAASGHGRVVMMTSTGALGADNMIAYATAKAAVIGLGRSLALAGADQGIKVNLLSPMGWTRMMAEGMALTEPPSPEYAPDLVSAMLAILAHESCPSNGEIYLAGMRRYARLLIGEVDGYVSPGADVTPELLLDHWEEVDAPSGISVLGGLPSWLVEHEARLAAAPVEES